MSKLPNRLHEICIVNLNTFRKKTWIKIEMHTKMNIEISTYIHSYKQKYIKNTLYINA